MPGGEKNRKKTEDEGPGDFAAMLVRLYQSRGQLRSIGKEKRGPETLRNVRSVLDSSFHLRSIRRISAYRQGATIATEAISYSRLVVALTSKRGRKIASTRFCRARVSSWPTCIGDIDVVSERPALSTSVLAVPVREVRSRAAMRLARHQEAPWSLNSIQRETTFSLPPPSLFFPQREAFGESPRRARLLTIPRVQRRTTFHEHVNPWRPSRTPWSGSFYGSRIKMGSPCSCLWRPSFLFLDDTRILKP